MKTYATLAEIPARFVFATANAVPREGDKPEYRAHSSYAAALNHATKSKAARNVLRRYASTSTFTLVNS